MYGRTFVLVTVCSGFALGACTTQESEPNGEEMIETIPSVYESVHEELTLYTFVERFLTEEDVLRSVTFEDGRISVHVVLDDPARLDDLSLVNRKPSAFFVGVYIVVHTFFSYDEDEVIV